MRVLHPTALFVLFAALSTACPPSTPTVDAGPDVRTVTDVASDLQSPSDTVSSPPDSSTDSAVSDTGTDVLSPTDVVSPSDVPSPLGCTPLAYEGNAAWTGSLQVSPGGAFCAYRAREVIFSLPNDFETPVREALRVALAEKSRIQIAPGNYPLPLQNESTRLALPMCLLDTGLAAISVGAASMVQASLVDTGFGTLGGYAVHADFPAGSETLAWTATLPTTVPRVRTLGTVGFRDHREVQALRGERLYSSCTLRPTVCTDLQFGSLASVRLEEYTWRDSPGLGFAAATRVQGTIQTQTVELTDYNALTSVYGHHAFDRYHFVRFPQAQGTACGLRISVTVSDEWSAVLADCDGTPQGSPVLGTATPAMCAP